MSSAQNISVRSAQNKHADEVLLEWYRVNGIVMLEKMNALMFNVSLFHCLLLSACGLGLINLIVGAVNNTPRSPVKKLHLLIVLVISLTLQFFANISLPCVDRYHQLQHKELITEISPSLGGLSYSCAVF